MTAFKSARDVIEYAMRREEQAALFYRRLAREVRVPGTCLVLVAFAEEEEAHLRLLKSVLEGDLKLLPSKREVQDLRVAEEVEDPKPGPDLGYVEILAHAARREKGARDLYRAFARRVSDAELRRMFEGLAQEEERHKNRVERLYLDAKRARSRPVDSLP